MRGAVDTLFAEVAVALVLAAMLGVVANALRQPLIIAFILAGIVAGPDVLGIVGDPGELELLASIGISVLLFLVGLRLDLAHVREIGRVAWRRGWGRWCSPPRSGSALPWRWAWRRWRRRTSRWR